MNTPSLGVGLLLVATDMLERDECFRRSVILLATETDTGWVGFNIAGAALKDHPWVRDGGPLYSPLFLLTRVNDKTQPLAVGECGYALICVDPEKSIADMEDVVAPVVNRHEKTSMAISGYAGWDSDQLPREIDFGFWRVGALSLDELMAVPVEERWELAIKLLEQTQAA